jgi:hypothetical protein
MTGCRLGDSSSGKLAFLNGIVKSAQRRKRKNELHFKQSKWEISMH